VIKSPGAGAVDNLTAAEHAADMPAPARWTGTDARTTLGVGLTPLETRRDVVLHVALRAEQLGYQAFYLAEGWGHDATVLLAEVAVRTSRIRLGTGVLNVWGRSPATIAMLATSLHQVSDGRFTLGLGAGSPQLAEGLHDTLFTAPVARLRTVVQQVRRLLDGERLAPSFPGEHRALRLATDPAPQIPIHLAALGPAATRLAGELADGWCPFLLPCSALGDRIRILEQGTAASRQGRALPQICPSVPVAVSPDDDDSRRIASWWVAFYLTSMGPLYQQTLRHLGHESAVDDVIAANPTHRTAEVPPSADVLLDELTIWGDATSARERLNRWFTAGAQLPILTLPPNRPLDELDHMLESLRPPEDGLPT
jgi:alkanesulfonate monooxygenase SsuD/methylene tetrahydromethanopterin reductase-like flavin-dependent oxidoreductase (luciferase family)